MDGDERWAAAAERAYRGLVAVGATCHDAEDAVQDALERHLRKGTSEQIEKPEAWLYVVALRRWRRLRWRSRLFAKLSGRGADQSDPLRDAETRLTVASALQRLTPRERDVIIACYWIGMTQQEAAHALGIARGTVAALSYRAARRLRELLGEVHR